ncbi:hypothetical protein LCGC14_0897000 [marine sediment metagenome]|uniref:Right handed beta helix domain-containing protein n=1 Tax=marine sediment metagenome TaxID=412755 RepID=A0A0F9P2E1_9ZZZZ
MNKINNKAKLGILLGFIVVSLLFTIPDKYGNQVSVSSEQNSLDLKSSEFSINTSDYVTFVGPPIDTAPPYNLTNFRIFIDDSDPNYNWSKTAAENVWLTGSGVPGDPYIIENLYINAHGVGGGIQISRSTKHFIIRNNWITNSGKLEYNAGILLYDTVENGIIENNLITYVRKGFYTEHTCRNITARSNYLLSDHTTAGFGTAFKVTWSNDISLINNIAINFYSAGRFNENDGLTISKNYLENTIWSEDSIVAPIDVQNTDNSIITYNGMGGVYTNSPTFVHIVSGSGNIVFNNSQTITVPDLDISGLQTQDTTTSLMVFSDSHDNLIAHNFKAVKSGAASQQIPGFDFTLLLVIIGISSVIILMIQHKKH